MKRIKMVIYGEPGVGKSVFASQAPKPFFITTDGNYEWLEDFGAKPEAHKQVFNWEEAKKAFSANYDNYETIVVDLTEDLFKWCEYEYCKRNGYEHVSDIGFGKGYDITRNEFFIELSKLLNQDKHIILIMHGITFVTKDRRGVEHTKYAPTSRIPDKVIDMIEGRVRYFLRCYLKAEEIDGNLIKKRYLSLVPKENEFGIIRGVNENSIPHDIPLDFKTFAKIIGLDVPTETQTTEPKKTIKKVETQVKVVDVKPVVEEKVEEKHEIEQHVETQPEVKAEVKVETPVVEEKHEEAEEKPVLTNADKLAAIKAKLAALKAGK